MYLKTRAAVNCFCFLPAFEFSVRCLCSTDPRTGNCATCQPERKFTPLRGMLTACSLASTFPFPGSCFCPGCEKRARKQCFTAFPRLCLSIARTNGGIRSISPLAGEKLPSAPSTDPAT